MTPILFNVAINLSVFKRSCWFECFMSSEFGCHHRPSSRLLSYLSNSFLTFIVVLLWLFEHILLALHGDKVIFIFTYKEKGITVGRAYSCWLEQTSDNFALPYKASKAIHWRATCVRLQNLPWSKTGLVSRQVLHPLSKLQNWIWSKTGRYKTGLVSNTKIEASLRATKPKPWQSNLTSDTVEIFIQNEKAGLVPMQSRFRSRHKAGFGAVGLS